MAPALRTLYFIRFGFALVWAILIFFVAGVGGPVLTVLLVIYPLVDAAAVVWQLRTEGPAQASRVPEVVNVVVSILAAVALAVTPSAGALVVWGVWALVAGAVQLLTALLRRKLGGQIPLIVSGAISVFAGVAFATQGAQGAAISAGVGAYALLGGVFFLVAAIRLSVLLRRAS